MEMKANVILNYKKVVENGLEYNLLQIQKPIVFTNQVRLDSFNKAISWQREMIFKLNEYYEFQKMVDSSYDSWISVKIKYSENENTKKVFANQIMLTAFGFINNAVCQLSTWLDKFKDEEEVLKELKKIKV